MLEALSSCSGIRSRARGFIRVWPAAANRAVARCTTVCPWNGRQMTCPGMMVDSERWPVKRGHQAALLQCLRGLNTLRAVLLISVFIGYSIRLSALFHFHVHIHSLTDRSSVLPLRAPSAPPLASSNHRPPPAISTSFPYGLPSLTTAASTPPSFAQTDQIRLSFRNADTQNTRSLIHSLPSPATRIHTRTDNQLPSSADQHDRRIKSHFEYEVASSTFLSCPVLFKNHRSSSFPHTIPSSRCFHGSSNYGS